jgi:hypothetical protein
VGFASPTLRLFEIAVVFVRFEHVADQAPFERVLLMISQRYDFREVDDPYYGIDERIGLLHVKGDLHNVAINLL